MYNGFEGDSRRRIRLRWHGARLFLPTSVTAGLCVGAARGCYCSVAANQTSTGLGAYDAYDAYDAHRRGTAPAVVVVV